MADTSARQTLVLITGSARSGTSSLAGSLAKLGLDVPGPYVTPGPINPKGFYEAVWVVDFHRRLLESIGVHGNDSSPWSASRVGRLVAADDGIAARLSGWLADQTAPVVVVKDNQIRWFLPLWYDVARRLGFDVVVLTALRHPAEVVGSRDLAWGEGRGDDERVRREVANTAVWLNVALQTAAATEGRRHAYLRYTDLLDDWRASLGRALRQLGLEVEIPAGPHELDTWLEPEMRRSRLTWDDVAGPAHLQEQAERVWGLLGNLVADPADAGSLAALDGARTAYELLYTEALALVSAETEHQVREQTARRTRRLSERVDRLTDRLTAERQRTAELTDRARASVPVPVGVADALRAVKRRLRRP